MHQIIFSGCGEACIELDVTPDMNRKNKQLEPWNQSFHLNPETEIASFSVGSCVVVKAVKVLGCWAFGVGTPGPDTHLPPNWRFRVFENQRIYSVCLEIISPTIPMISVEDTSILKTLPPVANVKVIS